MKSLSFLTCAGAVLVSCSLARAQDLTPPVVAKTIAELSVPLHAAPHTISVKNTFALKGVTGEVVRFTTTLGNIDVELYSATTPKTVANFLSYVLKGAAADGGYNNTLIQRDDASFVLQGGQYYINGNDLEQITTQAAVAGEAGISNTTGTIAMALSSGPNSATDAWFFNLGNNSVLDNGDGGPFTVFGRVIEDGMNTINAINALKVYDFSSSFGEEFETVPLLDTYSAAAGLQPSDFVYTQSISPILLTTSSAAVQSLLVLKVLENSNPKVVDVTLVGRQLKLKFPGKVAGTAKITLQATDAAHSKVTTSFKVIVR